MKKNKILIITLVLGILFLTSYLYNSYATSTGVSLGNDENTYDILLNDSTDTVTVPAKSSKTIYYQFSNTNKGTVNYHIGYTSNNVIAKVWWDTEDRISDTIEQGETKFIKLKLINETDTDDTITIKPVLGYVNGGDVIPDSNTTLVTSTINETNTMSIVPSTALNTLGIAKTTVEEISFVKDNIVPANSLGSTNMNNDGSIKMWYTASNTEGMYKVYIGSDNGITTLSGSYNQMFLNYSNLIELNLKNIDTTNVTSMSSMFRGLTKLTTLDLSSFNTENVRDMSSMFLGLTKLTTLDLSSFNTENVRDMSNMFYGSNKLTTLDLSIFNTSSVTTMRGMFYSCSGLTSIDLSNFNTENVQSMEIMFSGCGNLLSLDLSSFNTPLLKITKNMFRDCSKLGTLNIGNLNTAIVTDMYGMFNNCSSLSIIDLSRFDTSSVSDVRAMFSGCSKLKAIHFDNADLSGITTNYTNMLQYVPTTVNIYLKDTQGNRDFMNNNFSSYTNVQYIPSS